MKNAKKLHHTKISHYQVIQRSADEFGIVVNATKINQNNQSCYWDSGFHWCDTCVKFLYQNCALYLNSVPFQCFGPLVPIPREQG